jgi:glutamate formiminotransferase
VVVVLLLESVPNVSEGRDADTIAAIGDAFATRARLLDTHIDVDHHRSVFTLVGEGADLVEALVAGVSEARSRIDLRRHDGIHPRIGAADVVPIVPLRAEDMPRATEVALEVADRVAAELSLPVFLYGAVGAGRRPSFFRSGGTAGLQARIASGEVVPDRGPARLDPTAGGVIVGARPPLVAFNVDLLTDDLEVARAVAARVREAGGGLPGVRALGLALPRQRRVQVSLNVEDVAVPLAEVVEQVVSLAHEHGVAAGDAELVGLLPLSVALRAARVPLRLPTLDLAQALELRALGWPESEATPRRS